MNADFWDMVEDPAAAMAEKAGQAPSTGIEAVSNPFEHVWSSPGPVADAFYWDDADVCLIRGPVGSGKTTSNLRKPFRRALTMMRSTIDGVRHYKVVIARATYRQLWQTTIPSWFEVVPRKMGTWAGGRGDPVTHTLHFEDDNGPVHFIAEFLAFGESIVEIQANVRGVQTTDFELEEADTVHSILFSTAMTRIDRYPAKRHFQGGPFWPHPYARELQSYGQLNATYNAPEEGNWILGLEGELDLSGDEGAAVSKEIREAGIRVNFYRQPGYGEPGTENMHNLGPAYYPRQVAVLKASGQGHEVDRLVHNVITYRREGDPVFEKEFNRRIHVSPEPLVPRWDEPLIVGLDQGFFGAAVIMQFVRPNQWRIYAELWDPKRILARPFGRKLHKLLHEDERFRDLRKDAAYGDMAGEQGNAAGADNETWNRIVSEVAGITILPQRHGSNRIEPRLNVWRAAMEHLELGQPGLLIDPSCRLLIRGMEAKYVWAEEVDKAGNRTTKPKKRGCREADVIDAGGYALLSQADAFGKSPADGEDDAHDEDWRRHNGGPELDDFDDWQPTMGLG